MKRVLVTGGSGFVGRQILNALSGMNCDVKIITRTNADNLTNLGKLYRTQNLFTASDEELEYFCKDIDIIIHSAWYAEPGKYLESPLNIECLSGTLRLAQAANRTGVERFVGIGTCFEYDLTYGYLKTTTPLKPKTLYGSCKASCYLTLLKYFDVCKMSFSWCRLFYLYGDNEDSRRLVPYLHAQLSSGNLAELTSGKQLRDFMDVAAAGRDIAHIALSNHTGPRNICSGKPVTVAELALKIADTYGRRDLLRFGSKPENPNDPACVIGECEMY